MESKSILKSKTFWVQILTGVAAFIPNVQTFIAENPVPVLTVLAAINTAVRFATFGKVTLFNQ